MAKIKLSAMITDIRGKLGGSVFQNSQGGLVLKTKSSGKKNKSSWQSASSNSLSVAQSAWISLSSANKSKWNQYAKFVRLKQKFNESIAITGQQLFIKYNYYFSRYSKPLILSPLFSRALAINYTVSFLFTSSWMRIYVSPAFVYHTNFIVLKVSRPMSTGITSFPKDLRLMSDIHFATLYHYFHYDYVKYFGSIPAPGSIMFWKFSLFSESTVTNSPWQQGRYIVTY